jgi:anti-anti-sigma regulatory factor
MHKSAEGHNRSAIRLRVHEAGARVAVAVEGRLSVRNVEALTGRLARLNTSGKSAIIIDFSRLKHADYRSLPSLSSTLRRLSMCGCNVLLCNVSEYIMNIFRVVGCEEGLEIYERKQEAVRALRYRLANSNPHRSSRAKAVSAIM